MSEAKHTPGPWQLICTDEIMPPENRPLNSHKHVIFVWNRTAEEQDQDHIAVVDYGHYAYKDDATQRANARLIASAPKLLEALQGMLTWARRVKELNPGPEVGQALSAIAEALGKGGDV